MNIHYHLLIVLPSLLVLVTYIVLVRRRKTKLFVHDCDAYQTAIANYPERYTPAVIEHKIREFKEGSINSS